MGKFLATLVCTVFFLYAIGLVFLYGYFLNMNKHDRSLLMLDSYKWAEYLLLPFIVIGIIIAILVSRPKRPKQNIDHNLV